MAKMSDARGPVREGPSPVDQSESVTDRRRPTIRFVARSGKPTPFTVSATVTNVASGTFRVRPLGRRTSPQ
jgi:hypothetical protein